MRPVPSHFPLLALALVAGAASASEPTAVPALVGPTAMRCALPADRVLHDVDEHGALWAFTPRYKAAFDARGATFVPFLGSSAPRNFPLVVALAGAHVDGEEIELAQTLPARDADRIAFERGAVREVYALSPDGMEQSFVFDAAPGAGELVLDVRVDTDLAPREDAAGFVLSNELGGVSISRAVAYDASGRRLDLATTWTGAGYSIRVPESFVASARYPLVVDPTFTPFTVATLGADSTVPDVSADPWSNSGAYVIDYAFSATDHDVMLGIFDAGGTGWAFAIIDATGEDWRRPSIAFNATTRRFLIAAEVGAAPLRSIRGRVRGADLSGPAAAFTISAGFLDHSWPDVGGDVRVSASSRFCVVWQHEISATQTAIEARLLDADGVPVGGTITLESGPGSVARHPSISKSTGDASTPHGWVVAWDRSVLGLDRDILARQISAAGVLQPPYAAAAGTTDDAFPAASSLTNQGGAITHMVAFQRVVSASDRDVVGTIVVGNAPVASPILLTPGSGGSQIAPAIETDGVQFFTVHMVASPPGSPTSDLRLDQWVWTGTELWNTTAALIGAGSNELWPQIALDRSSGGASVCGYVAWQVDDGAGSDDVMGARYCGLIGGPSFFTCPGDGSQAACPCGNEGGPGRGCGNSVEPNGAFLRATGAHATGWDTTQLEVAGVPPSATCLFFQGSQSVAPMIFGDGLRCVLGDIVRLGTSTASAGAATYPGISDPPVSIRGQIPAGGGIRHYQVWYRNPPFFCLTGTYNWSNGVQLYWTR